MKRKCLEVLTNKSSLVYRQYSSHIIGKKLCANALYLKHDGNFFCMECGWKIDPHNIHLDDYYINVKCIFENEIGIFIKDVLPN